jgi:hypothetical protein
MNQSIYIYRSIVSESHISKIGVDEGPTFHEGLQEDKCGSKPKRDGLFYPTYQRAYKV